MLYTPARFEQSLDWGAELLIENLRKADHPVPWERHPGVRKAVGESVSYDEALGETARNFAARFSPAELRDLTQFYKSALGQKSLTLPGTLSRSGAQIGQLIAQRISPKLRELGLGLPGEEKKQK